MARPEASRQYNVIALHNVDQAYGGPEEGGWYYDCGEPCKELADLTRVIKNRNAAWRYFKRMVKLSGELNQGKREVWSVLYDGDRVTAVMQKGTKPYAWPEERPHYE
jgi:hypothetical protein